MPYAPDPANPTSTLFLCQYYVNGGAASGDSGAPAFQYDPTGRVTLYGIVWAGTSSTYNIGEPNQFVFSPIDGLEKDIYDIRFYK